METLILYFGKMILCSGVMFGYYFVFLKDKTFHHYNRFYLLSILFLSIFLPLIKVDYFTIEVNPDFFLLLKNLKTVSPQNFVKNDFNIYPFLFATIGLVSVFFILKFLFGLIKIQRLKTQFPKTEFEGINFYETPLEDAPFSFFRNLFWKNSIELQSDLGRQILKHEMVHIEQKHTWDKIIMTTVNSLFWFNPVFHLIKKEIFLIHEYLADKKAVKQSDTKAFAQMLLSSHFTGTSLPATSPFLSSNLKKRIIMLKKSHTKFSYLRKISALPIIFFLAFAYLVNAKNREIKQTNEVIATAVSEIKKDTIIFKKDDVKITYGQPVINSNEENFINQITKSDRDVKFSIGSKKVTKTKYLEYYNKNKHVNDLGFMVRYKSNTRIPKEFSVVDLNDEKQVGFGRAYDEKIDRKNTGAKTETFTTTAMYSDDNPKKRDIRNKYTYTTTANFSEDMSKNPVKESLQNAKDSDIFLIENKKVSKSEYSDFVDKNFGKKEYGFSYSIKENNNIGNIYSAYNATNLQSTNKKFMDLMLKKTDSNFKNEAEKVKAESKDLSQTIATENPNYIAPPVSNLPWVLKTDAITKVKVDKVDDVYIAGVGYHSKALSEDKNIKYYVDGKLVNNSSWKAILPKNIKSINVMKDQEGRSIYIITEGERSTPNPILYNKIFINGKLSTQSELDNLNKDSIKTQNINKNKENGKSFNEIRVTTK